MEVNQVEIASLSQTSSSAEVSQVLELNDLQLAFVGGGIAELVGV
jgi:hypothetical protein